ncbi:MAG TPA: phenylacetate--CoA ligase family protein [Chromatiaceae bacterium]|jgi:phenylacetate-CoA ligase|nr:MAG: hypothetical protein N838_00185 [Thiohalocapsa sp. PB-PSB1]QQO53857.1 MAG: phenylacetate--CoA ligase family protein [Thiohalocapsa sp. PB-PSB1]HBG96023.1 phenylacetate--CoA ligase family protein [Chromatiaceae bacterium]HCS91044.1 phenylacetate--CoA ligase family protein [Chromatiaceae bacterium]
MTEFYTRLVRSLLFPLHERLKGHHSLAVRRELERSQWLRPTDLLQYQNTRLRQFIADVYQHVPFYRKMFDTLDIGVGDIIESRDLQRLPFLDKAIIRANSNELRSMQATHLARCNTGGSSGEPLVFWVGKERISHDVAAKWRATRWWDVDIGDREIVVWGSPIELGAQDRVRALRDRLLRTRLLPAFEFSSKNLTRYLDEIRHFRPRMLFGYPSSLALIARHAEATKRVMSDLDIRVAFVTAERLYEEQRADIERVFACPVANGYGGRDAGFIAHACPQGNLHITAEDIVVEIVDGAGKVLPAGEMGEIVITHLASRDFPFIRYRTGDVGSLGDKPCACGRGLPLLQQLEGRTTDFIVAQDGTVMHGLALIYILRDLTAIDEFKILQESLDRIQILIKSNSRLTTDLVNSIVTQFKRRLGAGVSIEVEQVDHLARERSGKFRYVVSAVPVGVSLGEVTSASSLRPHRIGLE